MRLGTGGVLRNPIAIGDHIMIAAEREYVVSIKDDS